MPDSAPPPFLQTLRWLATHAGYPAGRLPPQAELLLLVATAAAIGDVTEQKQRGMRPPSGQPFTASLRNYTIQRRGRAHMKSDNGAKV